MKPSHLTSPRTLGECHFSANADPIERPGQERMDWQDRVVVIGSIVALVASLAVVLL